MKLHVELKYEAYRPNTYLKIKIFQKNQLKIQLHKTNAVIRDRHDDFYMKKCIKITFTSMLALHFNNKTFYYFNI